MNSAIYTDTAIAIAPPQTVAFRLLFIEDDNEAVQHFVKSFGQQVSITTASDVEEGFDILRHELPFDLIILNDSLGGLSFLTKIKASLFFNSIPVILLCRELSPAYRADVLRAHALDAFPVDVREDVLRTRLDYLIRKKQYVNNKPVQFEQVPFKMPLGKRMFDIAVAGTALTMLSPIMAVVALMIRLDSKGPIFYKSKRVGAGYRIFDMIKFRSMRVGADQQLNSMAAFNMYNKADNAPAKTLCDACQAAGRQCRQPLFLDNQQVCEKTFLEEKKSKAKFSKFRQDPRVTRLGQFLRNTSLDELPQLINIFRGDMSLVGNRPLPMYEAEKLTTIAYARRFAAPAGLTGLWQVTKRGKAAVSDEERIQLDVLYAKTYSFKVDFMIMLRTCKALFQKENV